MEKRGFPGGRCKKMENLREVNFKKVDIFNKGGVNFFFWKSLFFYDIIERYHGGAQLGLVISLLVLFHTQTYQREESWWASNN